MKIVFFTLTAILVSCNGLIYGGDREESFFDLCTTIDELRMTMKNGNAINGIPIWDPFKLFQYSYKIQEGDLFEARGFLRNLQINELSNFTVLEANYNLYGIKIELHFLWDSIKLFTNYSLMGTLKNFLRVYGIGDIETTAKGLRIYLKTSISTNNCGKLYLKNFQSEIKLQEYYIKVTGLFDNEEISKTVSVIMSDTLPQLIDDYQEELTNIFNSIVTGIVDDLLKDTTMWDLLFPS